MYKITNIDDVVKTFNNDAELIHYVRNVAVENEDEDMSIICLDEALEYLEIYCPDLKLKAILFETTENCPHCDTEQTIHEGVQLCPNCNKPLVACSMCNASLDVNAIDYCDICVNGSKFILCEFDEETGCIIDNEGE